MVQVPNRDNELPEPGKEYNPQAGENFGELLNAVIEELNANSLVSSADRSTHEPVEGQLFVPAGGDDPWSLGDGVDWNPVVIRVPEVDADEVDVDDLNAGTVTIGDGEATLSTATLGTVSVEEFGDISSAVGGGFTRDSEGRLAVAIEDFGSVEGMTLPVTQNIPLAGYDIEGPGRVGTPDNPVDEVNTGSVQAVETRTKETTYERDRRAATVGLSAGDYEGVYSDTTNGLHLSPTQDRELRLTSVTIDSESTGDLSIGLWEFDSETGSGEQLDSSTVTLDAGVQTVSVDLVIPGAGDYMLAPESGVSMRAFTEVGDEYPIQSDLLEIVEGASPEAFVTPRSNYYWFFDIGVEEVNSTTASVSVTPEGDLTMDSVESLTVDQFRSKTLPAIDVAAFGAVGDGATDDTEALKAAANALEETERSILRFDPGATYNISDTIEVDADEIRVIDGVNAYLAIDGDFPALRLVGNKTGYGANPDSDLNQELKASEMNTQIKQLQVVHQENAYEGTGIELEATFGTRITGCHISGVEHGIHVPGRHRNLIFDANHVYDISGVGMFFDDVNLHQVQIVNNHVSYCDYNIRITDGSHANYHIIGNALEAGFGVGAPETTGMIEYTGLGPGELTIVGNDIQDHGSIQDCLIRVEGMSRACNITSNYINNTSARGEVGPDVEGGDGIVVADTTGVNISGNVIDRIVGDSVRIEAPGSDVEAIAITGNTFDDVGRGVRLEGNTIGGTSITGNAFNVAVEGVSSEVTSHFGLTITDNSTRDHRGTFVDLHATEGFLHSTTIADNGIQYRNESEDGALDNAISVVADAGVEMRGLSVTGNSIRGRSRLSRGIDVQGDEIDATVLGNNTLLGLGGDSSIALSGNNINGASISLNSLDSCAGGILVDAAIVRSVSAASNGMTDISGDDAILITGEELEAIAIGENTFNGCAGGISIDSANIIIGASITGNAARDHTGRFVSLSTGDSFNISSNVSGNAAHYADSVENTNHAIGLEVPQHQLRLTTVTNNVIRGRSGVAAGVFASADTYNGVIIKNNIAQDTTHDLPAEADSVIINDNLNV